MLRPAPIREPPFDDEVEHSPAVAIGQHTLPFPAMLPPVRHRNARPSRSPARAALPDPAIWTRRLLLGVIEAAGDRRPLAQLGALLSPSVAFGLRQDLTRSVGRHRIATATVSSVRSSEPADGVAEVCATLRTATRAHAVALRVEARRGEWICTRLVIG